MALQRLLSKEAEEVKQKLLLRHGAARQQAPVPTQTAAPSNFAPSRTILEEGLAELLPKLDAQNAGESIPGIEHTSSHFRPSDLCTIAPCPFH